MSYISQVTVGGTTYDIKDATARTDKDKVAQYNANVATDNSYYPITFSYSTSSSDVTTYLKKTNSIYYNPYAKELKVSGTNSTTGKSHATSVYYNRLKVYDRYFEDPTDISTLVEECIEITPTDITVTEGGTWDGTNASLKDSITELKSNLIKCAVLTTSINITYQDANSIGFRNIVANAVDITTLQGYPTGKTIIGTIPIGNEAIISATFTIVNGTELHATSKISGTRSCTIYVLYTD